MGAQFSKGRFALVRPCATFGRLNALPNWSLNTGPSAAGRLARLKQDGWTIDYLQYATDSRPRKLTVSREELEIRLVADSWGGE